MTSSIVVAESDLFWLRFQKQRRVVGGKRREHCSSLATYHSSSVEAAKDEFVTRHSRSS
jgi:hypothetical protein